MYVLFSNILLLCSLAINGHVNQFAILNVNALYDWIKERKGKRDDEAARIYTLVKGEKHGEKGEEERRWREEIQRVGLTVNDRNEEHRRSQKHKKD